MLPSGQNHILEMIAVGEPLDACLSELARFIEASAPGMLCSILLLDPDGLHLRSGAAPSLPADYVRAIDGKAIGPSAGSCGTAAFRREPVIVEDIATDPLWADYREVALRHDLRACWSTPIFDGSRRVLGTFALYYREPRLPSEEHLRWIGIATHIAAIAISRDRSQAALRVSDSRHRRLVESNIIAVMIANLDGSISEANDAFLEMLGHTRGDFEAGRVRWDAMTPPEWSAQDQRITEQLQASGATVPFEKEYLHKDGHRVPIRATVALLQGRRGDCICLIEDLTEHRRAEAALRASESNHRTLVESASDGIFVADPQGRYEDVNAAGCRMLGYTREELRTMSITDLVAGGEVVRVVPEVSRLKAGEVVRSEWQFRRKDGTVFLGEVSGTLLPGGRLLGILRDITERKIAEEQLREKSFLLSESQRIGHIGTWSFELPEGRVRWSDETYRIYRVAPDTFVLTPASFFELIHPDDRPAMQEWVRAAESGEEPRELEFRIVPPDGDIRILSGRGEWLPATDSALARMVGTVQDITERKRAERALWESEEKFSKAFHSNPSMIVLTTLDGKNVDFNESYVEFIGRSREEMLGQSVTDLQIISVEEHQKILDLIQGGGGSLHNVEVPMLAPGGRLLHVLLSAELVSLGGVPHRLTYLLDITERKRAEAALAEQVEELRRWHAATLGRESRILELKREVNQLLVEAGRPPRYASAGVSSAGESKP